MNLEIPERANYLRTIWHELSRIHSHLLWLGLFADSFGFESLFMHCWRLRETVLEMFEMTTGGRVIFSVCKVGGVRKDIDDGTLAGMVETLNKLKKELDELAPVFIEDKSVKSRSLGVGVLSYDDAVRLGTVGPMARASGVVQDMRLTGTGVYEKLDFEPVIEKGGDSYARTVVRIKEVYQSIDLISKAVAIIPGGEIETAVKGTPNGEYITRLEQPRGEAYFYAKGGGTKFLERMRVRTPTNQNIPSLVKMLQGCDLADVPVLVLTIDPCISCTER